MTLTVGRAELGHPQEMSTSGSTLSISGLYVASGSTAADRAALAQAVEQQLLGMVNNQDEPVFPITYETETRYNGYYRNFSVSWSWVNRSSGRLDTARWSVTCERVADFAQPTIEIQSLCVTRTNSHSIAPSSGIILRRFDQPGWRVTTNAKMGVARTTADGYGLSLYGVLPAATVTASYQMNASTHYGASASIETAVGTGWEPFTGRQLDDCDAAEVRITNQFLQVAMSDAGVMTVGVYDSVAAAWEPSTFALWYTYGSNILLDEWSDPAVVVNSLDRVAVRYSARPSSDSDYGDAGALAVTISLNAGEAHASVNVEVLRSGTRSPSAVVFGASSTTAATAITGGLRRTSDDANGNRWVIATPHTKTNDTTNGKMSVAMATTRTPSFMVAQSLNGASAVEPDLVTDLTDQYFASVSSVSRVVAR